MQAVAPVADGPTATPADAPPGAKGDSARRGGSVATAATAAHSGVRAAATAAAASPTGTAPATTPPLRKPPRRGPPTVLVTCLPDGKDPAAEREAHGKVIVGLGGLTVDEEVYGGPKENDIRGVTHIVCCAPVTAKPHVLLGLNAGTVNVVSAAWLKRSKAEGAFLPCSAGDFAPAVDPKYVAVIPDMKAVIQAAQAEPRSVFRGRTFAMLHG